MVHISHSRAALIPKCFSSNIPLVLVRASCTYVHRILEYCTPVWFPHHIGLDEKEEKVQPRFTKRIYGLSKLSKLSYEDLTLRTLDVLNEI
jgi:hypothetical protein